MLVRVKWLFILRADGRTRPFLFAPRVLSSRVFSQTVWRSLLRREFCTVYFGNGQIARRCRTRFANPRCEVVRGRQFLPVQKLSPKRLLYRQKPRVIVFSFACVYCDRFFVVKAVSEALRPREGCAACARILHIKSGQHAGAVAGCAVESSGAFAADAVEVSQHAVSVGLGMVSDRLHVKHVAV